MPADQLIERGAQVMTVCNACRYCEQYCPVFPAMERRLTFGKGDLSYLANLCHNCGECLYACQYAPPHEFGIDVPGTLAVVRTRSYQDYCWPRFLAAAYQRSSLATAVGLAAILIVVMLGATLAVNGGTLPRPVGDGDFYAVLPHEVMVLTFGGVFLFAVVALCIGALRFWREVEPFDKSSRAEDIGRALRDALTLRHLHSTGDDCTTAEEARRPWRRWLHHCTFYGFMLCGASTSVAAIYHSLFGWPAPYPYTSLPVILGTIGGVALTIGSGGLWVERRGRDRSLRGPSGDGADESFLALLFLSAFTGLLLLALRERAVMSALLIVHLGVVMALFLTLPYGKFVHAIYRTAALIKYAKESRDESRSPV
jgi:citrate/tricarballylate utilization protein